MVRPGDRSIAAGATPALTPARQVEAPEPDKTIHLATKCADEDEFVQRFHPFAGTEALLIPGAVPAPAGTEGRFVIVLRDGRPVMQGRCRVEDGGGQSGKPQMLLTLVAQEPASRAVHERLLSRRRVMGLDVTAVPGPGAATKRPAAPRAAAKNLGLEQRTPGGEDRLPANPLAELDPAELASFVECTLFEAGDAAKDKPPYRSRTQLFVKPVVGTPAEGGFDDLPTQPQSLSLLGSAEVQAGIGNAPTEEATPVLNFASTASSGTSAAPPTESAFPEDAPPADSRAEQMTEARRARFTGHVRRWAPTVAIAAAMFWLGFSARGAAPPEAASSQHQDHSPKADREGASARAAAQMQRPIEAPAQPAAVAEVETRLRITARAPNAVVFVNNRRIGPAPQDVQVPFGRAAVVKVVAPGFRTFVKRVVARDTQVAVDANLTPARAGSTAKIRLAAAKRPAHRRR